MSAVSYDRPIVVGYKDGSSDAALDWAATEAVRHDVPLRIVSAYAQESAYPWGYGYLIPPASIQHLAEHVRSNAASLAEDAAQRVRRQHPGLEVITTLAHSGASGSLVTASLQASLLVLGGHARHHRMGLASVSVSLAAHAACPVVVVPAVSDDDEPAPATALHEGQERPAPAVGQVVVGADDSPESTDAIGFAFEQANARGCGLTALHAWWVDPALLSPELLPSWQDVLDDDRAAFDAALAPWRARFPEVKVTRVIGRGPAGNALCAAAEGAELLVVGSRGHGGFASLLLGSVSRAVLQHAPCPVAVVRRGQLDVLHDLDRP